jgi:hypothetical protein
MSLVVTRVPFRVLRNSKFCFATSRICFCKWIRFAADVSVICGGRPAFSDPRTYTEADSDTGETVSILVVRKGAKNFLLPSRSSEPAMWWVAQISSRCRLPPR